MKKIWLFIFVALLILLFGCTPNPRPLNHQPDVIPEESTHQQPSLDFPDYRNDLGWSTNKQHDASKNPLKDHPSPYAGEDNWLHGTDRTGTHLGDGVYDANQHDYLKDANSDQVLDGDRSGINQTPLVNDPHLDWFDGDND